MFSPAFHSLVCVFWLLELKILKMSSDEDIFKSTIDKNAPAKTNALMDELDDEDQFFQSTVSTLPAVTKSLKISASKTSNSVPATPISETATSETQSQAEVSVTEQPKPKSIPNLHKKLSILNEKFDNFQQKYEIKVVDPQKRVDNMGSYIAYEVVTTEIDQTSDNLKADQIFKVRRRYNDFKWLYDTLKASEPFRFVGPMPPKGITIDRFGEEFIAERMSLLNDFMTVLSKHPVFTESKILKEFLSSQLDFKTEALKHLSILPSVNNSISGGNLNSISGFMNLVSNLVNAINNRVREPDFQDFYEYVEQ